MMFGIIRSWLRGWVSPWIWTWGICARLLGNRQCTSISIASGSSTCVAIAYTMMRGSRWCPHGLQSDGFLDVQKSLSWAPQAGSMYSYIMTRERWWTTAKLPSTDHHKKPAVVTMVMIAHASAWCTFSEPRRFLLFYRFLWLLKCLTRARWRESWNR